MPVLSFATRDAPSRAARAARAAACADVWRRVGEGARLEDALRSARSGLVIRRYASDLLVLDCAGDCARLPLAVELVRTCPPDLGLSIVARRPPASVDELAASPLDVARARARAGFGRGHLLEVVVHAREFRSATDAEGRDVAEDLVRALLGDARFDDWIGSVAIAPLARGGPLRVLGGPDETTFALTDIGAAVDAASRALGESLPGEPWRAATDGDGDWTLLEVEPGEGATDRHPDLTLMSTRAPELTKCWLAGEPFCSRRFSRHGERFAHVTVPHGDHAPTAALARRVALEERLAGALGEAGAVIAAGLGVHAAYVHLALGEPATALDVLGDVLRELGQAGTRVGFCDDELAREGLAPCDDA